MEIGKLFALSKVKKVTKRKGVLLMISEIQRNALVKKGWFRRTQINVVKKLIDLPESYEGFMNFLADFPDNLGETEVLRLEKIEKCNLFLVTVVFAVCKKDSKPFTYEFASWRMGPNSGGKGILFLRTEQEISHFLLLKKWKFAICRQELDCIGGFSDNVDFTLDDNIHREIQEEIGIVNGIEIVNLGKIYPDSGMTNNHPALYAGMIDIVPNLGHSNTDVFEPDGEIQIFPISELRRVAAENDDSYLLAVVARMWARGLLS